MNEYVPIQIEQIEETSLFNPESILETYYSSEAYIISGEDNDPDVFFEHGQWWLRTNDGAMERTYSVVLCGIADSQKTYLDFELLDEVEY